jgi:diphthamide biosynthesis protein 2
LKDYSVFHISDPPTSLLLILSSRVKSMHIFDTSISTFNYAIDRPVPSVSSLPILRRRYATLTALSSAAIIGVLVNTLSVANYTSALLHCQGLISRAGKKSYTFVVGKLNPAKLANFSEIDGWVVIGCWESSLVDAAKGSTAGGDYWKPMVTPFELELALTEDHERKWTGSWISDFAALLNRPAGSSDNVGGSESPVNTEVNEEQEPDPNFSDDEDEPPEFDLRTGRYVSRSRPMGRPKQTVSSTSGGAQDPVKSTAMIQRVKGDLATVNGTVSPAAEYLRSKRTWTGLGSDSSQIAYERDEDGKIRGATVEEGRSGVAKGYSVGEDVSRT